MENINLILRYGFVQNADTLENYDAKADKQTSRSKYAKPSAANYLKIKNFNRLRTN